LEYLLIKKLLEWDDTNLKEDRGEGSMGKKKKGSRMHVKTLIIISPIL
jgi:hypothetical protein